MQKLLFLLGLSFLFSVNIQGQEKADYSGTWMFDKVVSRPDDKLRTATIEMLIVQAPNEIKIGRGAEDVISYPINKETAIEVKGSPIKVKAELTNKGRLILNSQQTVKISNGDVSLKIKESFELSSDGNTLKVSREIQNSKGLPIIEAFTAKKLPEEKTLNKTNDTIYDILDLKNQFSQSVLNGKAKHLEIPQYPGAASVNRVTGSVPVRVIFNEEGKVVFAQAIFGHPLLKNSAVESAMKCTFEPVELDGKRIKVSGVIVYDFRP